MRYRFLYHSILCSLGLLLCTLTGCRDTADEEEKSDTPTLITFTLSVEKSVTSRSTRASGTTWGDEYLSESTAYDSDIDAETVQVVVIDGNANIIPVTKTSCVALKSDPSTYQYFGYVERELLKKDETYRFVVTANSSADLRQLGTTAPTFTAASLPTASTQTNYTLPMAGIGSFTVNASQSLQEAGNVSLLRAVSKYRIRLNEEMTAAGYQLSEVTLHRYNAKGYLLPDHYNQVMNTSELSFEDSSTQPYGFHPLNDSMTDEESTLAFFSEPESSVGGLIVYAPEFLNAESTQTYLVLKMTDAKGFTTNHKVPFKHYTEDLLMTDLQRNHVYDFVVTGIQYGLDVTMNVSDWTEVSEEWDFTEQISGDLEITWESSTYSAISRNTKDEYDEEGNLLSSTITSESVSLLNNVALVGSFNINSPVGATWYATLTCDSGDYFAFEFVDTDNITHVDTSHSGPTGMQATIRIRATQSNNTRQHVANLTVLVRYADGTSRKVESLSRWQIIQPI